MMTEDPRAAALDWVRRALVDELRDDPTIPTRAENLVAIAIEYSIGIELLVKWIHMPALGKRWTAAEFRRWCELFRAKADPPR